MFDLDQILVSAVAHGASDIHLKPNQRPHFRVNMVLMETPHEVVPPAALMSAIERIIPPHIAQTFREQHEADFAYSVIGIGRFRVNAFMAQGLPVLALRTVKTEIPDFGALNLPDSMKKVADAQRGIVIVSGATGSGKSTTLAAMIEYMNATSQRRIVTVEDPIEYLFTDNRCVITQREVGPDTDSFDHALRHVLRQDPDVIMIGEMRDVKTLKTAIMAAETGHLVLTTLHAATAPVAIQRMLEMFPNGEWEHIRLVLANTLQAVVCQRLIRSLDGALLPAVEVMLNTPVVKHSLEQNKLDQLPSAIEGGTLDGMQSFNQSLRHWIQSGRVGEEEGMKHASNQGALRMALGGIQTAGRRILMR